MSWEAPGDPEGVQKSKKKLLCCSKRALQTRFFDGFRTDNRLHVFRVIWHQFFTKEKTMKNHGKTMHVFTASLAFLNKATLTKHRILRCESYSFIFRVVASFS